VKVTHVSLLALLSLSLLSGALLGQVGPPSFGGGRSPGGRFTPPPPTPEEREKFRQKLGITVQQQEQMDILFMESNKQRRALSERLRDLFNQRQIITDVYDFDRSRESAVRKEIGQINNQLLKIHSDSEEKLRRILNREQFERLVALRKEMMRARREGRDKQGHDKGRSGTGDRDNGGKPRPFNL
jgi:Spy/CpxP family protein refolding chaperone